MSVEAVMLQMAQEVETLHPIVMRDMLPVLVQARREAADGLRNWLGTAEDAEQRFTAQQYRAVIGQLDQALATVSELEPAAAKGLRVADKRAREMAPDHIQRELRAFSREFGHVIHIPFGEAVALRRGDKALMKRFATSAARYAGDVGNDIRRQLAVGLVKNETIGELTARLMRHGGPRGPVALRGIQGERGAQVETIAEGLFRRYRGWGERLARTEVLNAYNQHADDSIAEVHELDPKIQRIWNAAADKRLCLICRELDGAVADVGKPFRGGYDVPPAHPNCRCTVAAWRSDWKN